MCTEVHAPAIEPVVVVSNERVAEGVSRIVLDAPRTAGAVEPGQFVHLRISRHADFILRRPFSVHRARDGRIEILYQVVGLGTRALEDAVPDDVMDVIGPLGHGWQVPDGAKRALVVAGGLGAAPMGMLVERLAERDIEVTLAQGAPSAGRLLARELFDNLCSRAIVATDDGSAGLCGFVTVLSAEQLERDRPDMVYVCGPEPMQRIVAGQCAHAGVPCQASLERLMGCGIGACLSCVVTTRNGLKRACVDGPVFDAADVVWDAGEDPEGGR